SEGADISDRPLAELDDRLRNQSAAKLLIWANVRDIVDLNIWAPTNVFKRWTANGHTVTLVLAEGTVASLDGAQVLFLRDYAVQYGLTIAEGEPPQFSNGSALFAYL